MSVDNAALFQAVYRRAKQELVPKLRVGSKNAFWIHRTINRILNWVYPDKKQDYYLHHYNTTLGFTVAMATKHGNDVNKFENWCTLCHEVVHARQGMRWTRPLMGLLYLWPISQGLLLLLLGWIPVIWFSGWWQGVFLCLWAVFSVAHFLPKWPDPWRKRWEFEAYSVSMHLFHKVHGNIPQSYIDNLIYNFTSMIYYEMEPNQAKIRRELMRLAAQIEAGNSPVKDFPIVRIAEEEYERLAA